MLHASQLVRASASSVLRASARTPMILFPDRSARHQAGAPKPHPAAPSDQAQSFDRFEQTRASGPHFDPSKVLSFDQIFNSQSSSSSSAGATSSTQAPDVVEDVHQLPKRYWATPTLAMSDAEMEAVNVRFEFGSILDRSKI